MPSARQATWDDLDRQYRTSIAHAFARYALSVSFEDLPDDVVHHAKRSLLDGLGNAIGGYAAPGRAACEAAALALGGPPEATVFGSGLRTGMTSATLVNCFMMRFLEYNDVGGGNHNEEAIPSLLAVSERNGCSGHDFLTALVISYEIGARVVTAATGGPMAYDKHGWSTDARGGLNMPPAIGKLMGLTETQIAHATAICAGRGVPLGILDADKEENSMAKNLRFGQITRDAIVACLLAKEGLTGPLRVVEGDGGYRDGILRGDLDLVALTNFDGWKIRDTRYKRLCANGSTQGYLHALINLVTENDLRPSDIASVKIGASAREARHTTAIAKKYPRNAETADHSAFYASAFAIKERHFGPGSADPRHFGDPVILELIEKIDVGCDPALPPRTRAGNAEITTTSGKVYRMQCDALVDHLSDRELEDKFRDTARTYMSASQIEHAIEVIWRIDKAANVQEIAKVMSFA
jgi:2-methylcitrate dehydratase